MDCQATLFISVTPSDPTLTTDPLCGSATVTVTDNVVCPAKRLTPHRRQDLAIQVLAGMETVSQLARQHEVSRKFLYRQVHTAEQALSAAFAPPPATDDVLFHLPVTRAWLCQLVLALVLICHSSYRGVIELLQDLFDYPLSLGTVHNIVRRAVPQAQRMNQQYDLSDIQIGAHDEIFQASHPVLVGVDTASTFCYLLSLEDHRDAETWGIRLRELVDRGFAPAATVGDGGSGLRAGQKLALSQVPCDGDHFPLFRDLEAVVTYLENAAYRALETCAQRERERARCERQGKPLYQVGQNLRRAGAAADAAIAVSDEVCLLVHWLRHDILDVPGPSYAERCELYDFVTAELRARAPLCPHRLEPVCRLLENGRAEFLAFAQRLDEDLNMLGAEFQCAPELLRRVLQMLCREDRDPRRWQEETALRGHLRGRFWEVCEAVAQLRNKTVRASSLVENLNSRLRGYFFLRRHLGAEYLSLLQFFLNHRRLLRSECPERVGRSPAEILTGQPLPHWLNMLGYNRFQRM
jgi:hypothetical protein